MREGLILHSGPLMPQDAKAVVTKLLEERREGYILIHIPGENPGHGRNEHYYTGTWNPNQLEGFLNIIDAIVAGSPAGNYAATRRHLVQSVEVLRGWEPPERDGIQITWYNLEG